MNLTAAFHEGRINQVDVFPHRPLLVQIGKCCHIFATRKEALYHHAISEMIYLLYRMQHDRFLEASSLLQPYLYQQLSLQEFAHSPVDELLRNPRYLMHLLRRISRFTLVEAMANQMHHHGADLDAVLQLHMVVLQIQIVMMQILIGIAEQYPNTTIAHEI